MATYNEALKNVFGEVHKFLTVTLKSEKLSGIGQKEKNHVVEILQKLFSDYPTLCPQAGDEGSSSSSLLTIPDESRNTTGSSHGSEEDYTDNIPDATVKDLNDATKMGYLDRKKDKGILLTWQKQYCVLHKNIMYCFKKPGDKKQKGAFFVTGYDVVNAPQNVKDAAKKDASFELVFPGKKTYQFCADNKQDLEEWREAINGAKGGLDISRDDGPLEDENYEPLHQSPSNLSNQVLLTTDLPRDANRLEEEGAEEADEIYEEVGLPPPPPALASATPQVVSATLPPPPSPKVPNRRPPPAPPTSAVAPPALPKRNLPPPPRNPLPETPKVITPMLDTLKFPPEEDFENLFYGIWSSVASSDKELSFERGDIVHIISRELDAQNWWVGEMKGKVGLVPKTYMYPAYTEVT